MSFNPVLLAVTIVMFCAGAVAGSLEYRRLLSGNPGLRHDNIHRYSLVLWLVLGSGLVLVGFLICCFLVKEIQWILPVWLEIRVSAVTYGLSAFVSSFLFGMLITGMIRHDKGGARRLFKLGLVVILALSVFQWKNEQLIAGRLDDTPWQGEVSNYLPAVEGVPLPERQEPFAPIREGFPAGIPFFELPDLYNTFLTNLHILSARDGGVDAFIAALDREFEPAMRAGLYRSLNQQKFSVQRADSLIAAYGSLSGVPDVLRFQTLAVSQNQQENNIYRLLSVLD